MAWDFETGPEVERATVPLATAATPSRSGRSLRLQFAVSDNFTDVFFESPWICGASKRVLASRTVSAWFYVDAPGATTCQITGVTTEFEDTPPQSGYHREGEVIVRREAIPAGQWVEISGRWPFDRMGFNKLIFYCLIRNADGIVGSIYVDQVSIR